MFRTADEIKQCAHELIAFLHNLQDARGDTWTQKNFQLLEVFSSQKNPELKSFFRQTHTRTEFLWDFISAAPSMGIFIAAESEQAIGNENQVQNLKHDFEKLLYVYCPVRLLITKARDEDHAKQLAETLADYARSCCLTFNPGAVFILHFGLWNNGGNVAYLWQSQGEPSEPQCEALAFELVAAR